MARERLIVPALAVALTLTGAGLTVTPSWAQGSADMSGRAQSQRGDPGQGSGSTQAQTAQVGAGTTNGSTTGFSGPDESGSSIGPGQLPSLPSQDLCQRYRSTPAYQGCLQVVLRQKPAEPKRD